MGKERDREEGKRGRVYMKRWREGNRESWRER